MLRTADKRLQLGRKLGEVVEPYIPLTYNTGHGGAGVASSASANTKGSYVALDSSINIDADGFFLMLTPNTASRDFLVDVAVGAAASEVNIISNLLISSSGVVFLDAWVVYIPLPLQAGERLSARCQASTGSSQVSVGIIYVHGGPYRKMRKTRATTYGANTADSGGTNVDCGAVSSTYGAWAQLSAATSNPIRSAIVCIGNQVNGARTGANGAFSVGSGAGGSEAAIVSDLAFNMEGTTDFIRPPLVYPLELNLAAGERLVMRGKTSTTDATDRLFDGVIIGFD